MKLTRQVKQQAPVHHQTMARLTCIPAFALLETPARMHCSLSPASAVLLLLAEFGDYGLRPSLLQHACSYWPITR